MRRVLWLVALGALCLAGCSPMEQQSELPEKIALLPIENSIELQKVWSTSVGKGAAKKDVKLLLAQDSNSLLAVDHKGLVSAVRPATGEVTWTLPLLAPVSSGPTVAEDKLVVGTNNGKVIAVDLRERKEAWSSVTSSEVLATPLIAADVVYVNSMDGAFTAFSLNDGRELWRFTHNLPSLVLRRGCKAAVYSDLVIAGFSTGKLIALKRFDGSVVWTQDVGHPRGRTDLQRMVDISADPVVVGDVVYAASYQGELQALNAATGTLVWDRKISSASGFSIADDTIYLSATNGDVYAVDTKAGHTLWLQSGLQGRRLSKPALMGRYIVVGDSDGLAHWLDVKTGNLVGRIKIDSKGVEATPIVHNNIAYILGSSGKLVAIEVK